MEPQIKDVIINGDCLEALRKLPDESVHCCVTSPPYYALRDYGVKGQIGQEKTPEEYIQRLVEVFRELKRVLRSDGTFWLNIADTYCGTGSKRDGRDPKYPKGRNGQAAAVNRHTPFCKAKDMIGIPWMLAFALRRDGWYLRSDIIWMKGNAMPESAKDRPSRSYEHIFLFTKSPCYYYDQKSVAEPVAESTLARMRYGRSSTSKYAHAAPGQSVQKLNCPCSASCGNPEKRFRNKRDVWLINTVPYRGSHYAAFPPKLAETCILAGCPENGIVIDPFFGSGTTGAVAQSLRRQYIGIELNADYCELARKRINSVAEACGM